MNDFVDLDDQDEEAATIAVEKTGFLPIHTNGFDRGFIAVVCLIAIHLFWMRFVESYLSIYVATAISVVLGYFIIRKG
jgi:predicted small integral membrane protein